MSTSSAFQVASNKTPFEIAYLNALRAIMGMREAEAGGHLNHVASLLKSEKAAPHTPGNSRDDQIESVVKTDLRDKSRLESLYGDYKYNEPDPITEAVRAPSVWIKNPMILDMIRKHVEILGDDKDITACQSFLTKTSETFRMPVPAFKAA